MTREASTECSIHWTYAGYTKNGQVRRKPYLLVRDYNGNTRMIGISVKAAEALITSGMPHGD